MGDLTIAEVVQRLETALAHHEEVLETWVEAGCPDGALGEQVEREEAECQEIREILQPHYGEFLDGELTAFFAKRPKIEEFSGYPRSFPTSGPRLATRSVVIGGQEFHRPLLDDYPDDGPHEPSVEAALQDVDDFLSRVGHRVVARYCSVRKAKRIYFNPNGWEEREAESWQDSAKFLEDEHPDRWGPPTPGA